MRVSVLASKVFIILIIITVSSKFAAKSEGTQSSLTKSLDNATRVQNGIDAKDRYTTMPRIENEATTLAFTGKSQSIFNDTDKANFSTEITQTKCKQGLKTNCSKDGSKKSEPEKGNANLTISEILLICGFAFTFIVGVFGNAFVCYVFGYKQRKRRVTETLFLYLGIVDLLASIVNPLIFIYWTITRYRKWDFGIIGCKILAPLAPITITISATIIIIISLDRYRAIVSPFKGRYSKTKINMIVIMAVILSILSYTGYVIHLEVVPGRTCLVPSITVLGNAIPYVIITIIRDIGYIVLFCYTSFAIFNRFKINEALQANSDYLRKRRKSSRKICRMLCCVGVVFAILVFPKDALSLASTISWLFPPGLQPTPGILYLNAWLKVLNVSNSCVNVFIYSRMHDRFNKELSRLFSLCLRRRSDANEGSNTMVTDDDYEDSLRRNGNSTPSKPMTDYKNDKGFNYEKESTRKDKENNERKKEFSVKFVPSNGNCSEAEALINSRNA